MRPRGAPASSTASSSSSSSPEQRQAIWRHVYAKAHELAGFLSDDSVLSQLAFDEAVEVALHTRLVPFSDGDWIYRQGALGTRGDSAFVLYDGSVIVEAFNDDSGSVYQERLEPGEIFGGMPMLAGLPHPETAIAETNTQLLEVDPFTYRHLLTARPEAARAITESLIRRYASRLNELIGCGSKRPRPMLHRFDQPAVPVDTGTAGA